MCNSGSRYALSVSGCTDRFSGTLQPFISRNNWTAQQTEEGIIADPSYNWNLPGLDKMFEICVTKLSSLATKYIQCKSSKTMNNEFLSETISSRANLLIDAIEALSGDVVTGKTKSLSADPLQAAKQVHTQCTAVLAHLHSYGGPVNMVKPEAMMDKESLSQYIKLKTLSATDRSSKDCRLWCVTNCMQQVTTKEPVWQLAI